MTDKDYEFQDRLASLPNQSRGKHKQAEQTPELRELTFEEINKLLYQRGQGKRAVAKAQLELDKSLIQPLIDQVKAKSKQALDEQYQTFMLAQRVRVAGKFIGTAHVVADWKTGIAYWGSMIGEKSYWGYGYGTEIKRLLAYYIFNILLLKKIDTRPEPKHISSVKTIERNGFRKVGKSTDKFGEPVDVYEQTSEEYFKMHFADKLVVLNEHITQWRRDNECGRNSSG